MCLMHKIDPTNMLVIKKDYVRKCPLISETLALSEAADTRVLMTSMIQVMFQLLRLPEVICKADNSLVNSTNLVNEHL